MDGFMHRPHMSQELQPNSEFCFVSKWFGVDAASQVPVLVCLEASGSSIIPDAGFLCVGWWTRTL